MCGGPYFKGALLCPQKDDIRATVEYLRAQGKKVSGLVGHSKGGTGVILYAAAFDDIPRVVNIAGRFDNMKGGCHCPPAYLSVSGIAKQLPVMSISGGAVVFDLESATWTGDTPFVTLTVHVTLWAL